MTPDPLMSTETAPPLDPTPTRAAPAPSGEATGRPIVIGWSDALVTGDAAFDDTHREFVELIETLARADDAAMPAAVDAAITHTQAHFRRETTLMQLHDFPPIHCHDTEHAKVLEVMLAVRDKVANGEHEYGRVLASALMEWLHVHVPTMDTVLALWLRERGVDADA
jgi:hemerythrin